MDASLRGILDLELIDTNLYRGASLRTQHLRAFGGQVAAQALMAAGRSVVTDRPVHSLHAYFLRPGDSTRPIVYQVDDIRDGRSFTSRRVVATQGGVPIFHLTASFQAHEDGYDHQMAMPPAPDPDDVPADAGGPWGGPSEFLTHYPFIDVRHVPLDLSVPEGEPVRRRVWFRATEPLPEDDALVHACVATYASDLTLLGTALLPRRVPPADVQLASLDHAMWFHRPVRADDWLLYGALSPSATNGRGLAIGEIWDARGRLVCTVVQEGLMRPMRA